MNRRLSYVLLLAIMAGWGMLWWDDTIAAQGISAGTINARQSGTWTVQPGNTANSTAWLVTGTGGVFPATQSGTWTVQPGNTANTTPWLVTQGGSSTFLSAQQAVTASAVALATNSVKGVCVKALLGNTINVYIGPTGITISTGDELGPGDGRCYNLSNTNLIFVIASTTGASVSWSAWN